MLPTPLIVLFASTSIALAAVCMFWGLICLVRPLLLLCSEEGDGVFSNGAAAPATRTR